MENKEIKGLTVLEVANRLSQELGCEVSVSRIRKYETDGLITAQRSSTQYRQFEEPEIQSLKIIILLSELGVKIDHIKNFLEDPTNSNIVVGIFDRIKTVEQLVRLGTALLKRDENG